MKFFLSFYRGAIHMAVAKENIEILKLLLASPKIDVNMKSI